MHAAAYHIPNIVTQNGNLKQFSGQGKLITGYFEKKIGTTLNKLLMMTTNKKLHDSAINYIFLGVEKNNDDARRILQCKTNHTDDPADILRAEHRIRTLKHRERQPRYYTKKSVEHWENTIKTKRKARKRLSYDKPIESTPTENKPTAIEPHPNK